MLKKQENPFLLPLYELTHFKIQNSCHTSRQTLCSIAYQLRHTGSFNYLENIHDLPKKHQNIITKSFRLTLHVQFCIILALSYRFAPNLKDKTNTVVDSPDQLLL